jgi:iron complex transport system substrate-binding protein
MRIVSLACSNTEIVTALGYAHLLVGVDDHSDFPEEVVAALPRVGPDLEIDVEKVKALDPDLVLASLTVPGHETVVEGIEATGLSHLTLAPTSLEEIYENILLIAARLEEGGVAEAVERARTLVGRMRVELAQKGPDPNTDPPRILIQWWPKPVIAPCGQSWVNPLIELAGGQNPLSREERPSRPLKDEEVAALRPDAIVVAWCGVHPDKYRPEVVYRNPVFGEVPAVRNGRVFCVPEAYLGRPGPRLVDGAKALRGIVTEVRGTTETGAPRTAPAPPSEGIPPR